MFLRLLVVVATLATVSGYRMQMKFELPAFEKIMAGAVAGVFAFSTMQVPVNAITRDELQSLSYLQVKGTGLANRCPEAVGEGSINLDANKKYKIKNLCIEPKQWQVEETVGIKKGVPVKEFVKTKLMTRQTYSLDEVEGDLVVKDGKAVFTEKDGIDYAATTVQLPGGERVPLLFTVKQLVATSSTAGPIKAGFDLGGSFTVPSYRTGLFLDPKGRGTTTGYDFAVALPTLQTGEEGDQELFRENNKKFEVLQGNIEFAVSNVNSEDNEFSGVFVSKQPSDTDLGGKDPKNILIKGIFYGKVEEAN